MNKIIFDKNEQKEIVEMYLNYIPINQIAQKYGVSKQPIYNVLKENNVKLHGEKKKLNDNQVTDIINMYQNGHTQQEIADMYGVNRWTIKNELKSHGIQLKNRGENIRKYILNEHYFDKIETEEQSYYLGLLWSDGCNKTDKGVISLKLQERDKYIIERFRDALNSNKPLYYYPKRKETHHNMWSLEINSVIMSKRLEELGMVANKSLILEFPKWLQKELIPYFIKGIVDGDGHISEKNFSIEIVGSSDICNSIKSILSDIGIISTIYNKTDFTKVLFISKKTDSINFLNWIYKDSTIHLIRKYNIYKEKYINNSLSA